MLKRLVVGCALALAAAPAGAADRATIDALAAQYAAAHGVPLSLVHRVIRRESNYNPRAVSRGNFGLMQIRHATARGMGYGGSAAGLLDARTNMAYAIPYLANAYRVAGGNHDRAVRLYSSGYYFEAKRRGMLNQLARGPASPAQPVVATASFAALPGPATDVETTGSVRETRRASRAQERREARRDARAPRQVVASAEPMDAQPSTPVRELGTFAP
jgi:soluble lytic murein transglycosylase-like protein